MTGPLTMFMEKDATGADYWSMTRVLCFVVALVFCFVALILATEAQNPGWPTAAVLVACVFAVPFKDLFKGASGAKLLGKFLDRFGVGDVIGAAVKDFVPQAWADGRDPDAGLL